MTPWGYDGHIGYKQTGHIGYTYYFHFEEIQMGSFLDSGLLLIL